MKGVTNMFFETIRVKTERPERREEVWQRSDRAVKNKKTNTEKEWNLKEEGAKFRYRRGKVFSPTLRVESSNRLRLL